VCPIDAKVPAAKFIKITQRLIVKGNLAADLTTLVLRLILFANLRFFNKAMSAKTTFNN
jgi:hypothetical protein